MDQMFLSLHGSCSTTRDDSITFEPFCDDSRGAINRFFRCCSGVLTTGKQVGGIPTSVQMHTSELQRHASCRGSAVQRRGSEVEEDKQRSGKLEGRDCVCHTLILTGISWYSSDVWNTLTGCVRVQLFWLNDQKRREDASNREGIHNTKDTPNLSDTWLTFFCLYKKISFPVRSMKRAWALTDCNLTEAFVVESSTQWHLQLPDLQINWSHSNSIAMASRIQMPCWGDMRRDWQPDHGHFLQKKGKKKTKQNWMIHLVSVHKLLSASLAFHHFLPVLLALMTFYHFSKAASSHNNWCSLSIWIREHL